MPDAANPDLSDFLVFGRAVSAAAVGFLALDASARITAINPAAMALLERPDDIGGRRAHDVLHAGPLEDGGCSLEAALDAGEWAERYSDWFHTGSGTRIAVRWVATSLQDRSGTVIVFHRTGESRGEADSGHAATLAGTARGAAELARRDADLVEARQSVADWRWLTELTQSMSSSLDESEVLHRLARMVVRRLADIVFVDLVADDGSIRRVGGASAAEIGLDMAALMQRPDVGDVLNADTASAKLVLSGRLRRLSAHDIDDASLLDSTSRTMLHEVGAHSVIIAPLVARERVVGVMVCVRRAARAVFDEVDEAVCLDVARRAGLAVDNARLYDAQTKIALTMQHALLPEPSPILPVRAAVRYLPAHNQFDVGGDWYDLFADPRTRDATVLLIGDVAGHDLRAATTMAAIRNLLRGVIVATDKSCAAVIEAVDANLDVLGIPGTASVVVMIVAPDGDGWRLRWSNAGHVPPVLITPDQRVELLEQVHGPILGSRIATARLESTRLLPTGSTLILYTDGLIETRTESIEASLMRLRQVVLESARLAEDPEALLAELVRRNHTSAEDDTAILVCHLRPREAPAAVSTSSPREGDRTGQAGV